jgi:polyisoprenoid-binding protein YceI
VRAPPNVFEQFEGALEVAPEGIELRGGVLGSGRDDEGAERVGLELTGAPDRRDFGLSWNTAIDGAGLLVGNRVDLVLEISAIRS